MELDKLVQFVEKYVRDYALSIFSILIQRDSVGEEGSAEQVLTADAGRTWVFAFISIVLGAVTYTAAISPTLTPPSPFNVWLILTVWLWIITAFLTHILCRALNGKGKFLVCLGVFLRLMSVAYILSGLTALTVSVFSRTFTKEYIEVAKYSAAAVQFVFLIFYMPAALGRAHELRVEKRIVIGSLVPVFVFFVNSIGGTVTGLLPMPMSGPPAHPPYEHSGPRAPPRMAPP